MSDLGQAGEAPAVEVRSAAKSFPDGTRAVDAVDITVAPGEFISLVGPSGCGKSTLLRMIAGLALPTAGDIRWRGGSKHSVSDEQRVVFVFQSPTLMPWASVRSNVRLPFDLAGQSGPQVEERVDSALELVGLSQFRNHRPSQLSGGMLMRASIARALVQEPGLLLMDEPFAALDEITRNRLDEELLALWLARRFAVVFVTHSIYEAVFLSQRVLVMSPRPGRIVGEIAIDEPFPRTSAFRASPRFAHSCGKLSELLADAVDAEAAS
jgi:NitT/TauT family transport system ATP-binding protein